jgi:peptide/nickel transport system permease protein
MAEMTNTLPVAEPKRHSFLVGVLLRLFREKPLGTAGAVIVLLLFLTGIFANFIAPHGYNDIKLADRLHPPSGEYFMGTDDLGRDVFSRIIYGARISMLVGLCGSALMITIAVTLGTFCGFLGGKFDLVVQRFVDAWMCLPGLFVILTVMSLTGPGILQLILVLGTSRGITDSRVIRSAVISIKQNVYMEAARAIGTPSTRVIIKHVLPNIMAPIIILFTISMGQMILLEATVSFLGFGVPPPIPSWGSMLSEEGRQYMYRAIWLAIWPGAVLSFAVYGINMFGDALRDLLDPRLRGGLGRYGGVKAKTMKKKIGLV